MSEPSTRVDWQRHRVGRLVLHVQPYSQAARDLDDLASRYTEALAAASEGLDIDAETLPAVDVYVAELPADGSDLSDDPHNRLVPPPEAAPHEITIMSAYGTEAPTVAAEIEITRALLVYGLGLGEPAARFWDEGLAGHVAARSGRSSYHAEAVEHCRQLLRDGALPPLAELLAESSTRVSALASTAACSFASYSIDRHGLPHYRRLLRSARAGDDNAFEHVYGMPLAIADRDWRRMLEASSSEAQQSLVPTLRRLVPIARPYWRTGLAVLACSLVGVVFSLALPLSFRFLIDNVLARRPLPHALPFVGPQGHVIAEGAEQLHGLVLLLAFLGLLYVANAAARLGMSVMLAVVGESLGFDLRARLVRVLNRLPVSYYARRAPTDVSQRVVNDVETLQGVITRAVIPLVSGSIAILSFAGLLVMLEPKLAIVTLAGLPVVAVIHVARRKGRRAAARERVRRLSDLTASVNEAASMHVVAKVYRAGQYLAERLTRRMEIHRQLNSAFARESALLAQSGALLLGLIQVAVLMVGGYTIVVSGGRDLAPGSLVAFYVVLNQLMAPIGQISTATQSVAGASASVERAVELLDTPGEEDRPDAVAVGPLGETLRFDDVTFAYPDGKPVLKGISLAIQAGSTVAFVGPSGAGKSSILHLLPRLYAPTRGAISWDGVSLDDVTLDSIRTQIGLVPQDAMLLNASVHENIRFGLNDVSDAAVQRAARQAAAHELIMQLPDGYDTVVGQSGIGLSGGQQQRIALARAILRRPSLLILDEATSALDASNQRRVQEQLRADSPKRTIIKVAHRLETIVDADVIFVLDDGRLVEQGSHADLIQRDGLYARLYADQMAPFEQASGASAGLAVHRLRERHPFSALSPSTAERLEHVLVRVELPAGADLYRRADRSDAVYVLVRGRMELRFGSEGGREPVEQVHAVGLLGDSSFLADRPRPATARAVADAVLFRLDRDAWSSVAERES